MRSIPARAGEPVAAQERGVVGGVYPRTGGGTGDEGGQSPSIPGVYPRTGGGTASCELGAGDWMGLSPHGRGNLIADCRKLLDRGSIPARAGEPSLSRLGRPATWVYPRTGGGTAAGTTSILDAPGVYPRTGGGTVRESDLADAGEGSIPARAGEPGKDRWNEVAEGVYPRTGGGTSSSVCLSRRGWGLSPHGRGNRISRRSFAKCPRVYPRTGGGTTPPRGPRIGDMGSIPARAGEPGPTRDLPGGVYPRTGGGTPTKQQTDNAQLLRNKCRVCVLTGS